VIASVSYDDASCGHTAKSTDNPAMHVRKATVVIDPTPILQPRDKEAYRGLIRTAIP
jgi:hypothetical protein